MVRASQWKKLKNFDLIIDAKIQKSRRISGSFVLYAYRESKLTKEQYAMDEGILLFLLFFFYLGKTLAHLIHYFATDNRCCSVVALNAGVASMMRCRL